ncbi:MAG: hypothetical protein LPH21_18180 [Shewanella sp.]|nr:hypothetical protein [Shewanella sp.]
MEKKIMTALPMDSAEGVVLEMRFGVRCTLRCESDPTGFVTVIRGSKIRVTKEYANNLTRERGDHGFNHPQLGWVSNFAEVGAAQVDLDDATKALKEQADRATEEATEAKRMAAEGAEREAAMQAELDALRAQLQGKPEGEGSADKQESTDEGKEVADAGKADHAEADKAEADKPKAPSRARGGRNPK